MPAQAPLEPTVAALDCVLTAQLAVAWAGEGHVGEESRLGWWRSDLTSEFGGRDLFERLAPQTYRWAVLQAAREAARLRDAELRAQANDPDGVVSLFRLGLPLDERVEERLQERKGDERHPERALSGLRDLLGEGRWNRAGFEAWVKSHGKVEHKVEPLGRRLVGERPEALTELVGRLVAALYPLAESYPLPHYRGSK
jgi:hypothetical protein